MIKLNKANIPEPLLHLPQIVSWVVIATLVGLVGGSLSAIFLFLLHAATMIRWQYPWLVYFLPLAGVSIAFFYHKYGRSIESGNNLLIEEIQDPQKSIPLRMIPLVLFGTLITHLFGGSSGREGTAVQMGGAMADQFSKRLKLNHENRKILISSGISAGFGAVFGTPLAGAIFGLEIAAIGKLRYHALLPCFVAAIVADQICIAEGIKHTKFSINSIPALSLPNMLWAVLAGILFGLCALIFSKSLDLSGHLFKQKAQSPLGRAFWGGSIVISLMLILGTDRYLGLGIPVISEAFENLLSPVDFLFKIIFTAITLGSGFKGGEVTPIFFIGATLGNALSQFVPLPLDLLAGMGFVAVFAGASNAPLTCMIMGLELFGSSPGLYIALACVFSYIFSGHQGIYKSQKIEAPKYAHKN